MSALFVVHAVAHWAFGIACKYRVEEFDCGVIMAMLYVALAVIDFKKWTGRNINADD